MKMTGSREGFGNDKPLWKQRRGHLLQFPDHKDTEKENSSKNLRKTKEKEKAKNQAVTCMLGSVSLFGRVDSAQRQLPLA